MYNHKQSTKEVIRHALFRCGLTDTLDIWRKRRGANIEHVGRSDMSAVFSEIYANGAWVVDKDQDSLSGAGSTSANTSELLGQLSGFLHDVRCSKLVDIGCGDFNWMRRVTGDFDYLGIDIVPSVIEANTMKYGDPKRQFICMDASAGPIPSGDVAVCREVLFHLSFRDGLRLLRNIKQAGFKYILLTTEQSVWFNSDIRNGDHRRLNLAKAPYKLPNPFAEMPDDKVADGRVLAVWRNEALPA